MQGKKGASGERGPWRLGRIVWDSASVCACVCAHARVLTRAGGRGRAPWERAGRASGGRGWGVMSVTHFLCLSFPIRALVGWFPTGWNLAVGG